MEGHYAGMRRGVPMVDPRLRQRWVDARRQEGRRRLRVLAALAALVLVAVAGFAVVHSPLLRVRHVRIAGGRHEGPLVVATAAGLDHQTLMANFDPVAAAQAIRALPWVDTARVVRQWPATVRITITDRQAVATVAWSAPASGPPGSRSAPPTGHYAAVDATGRVLATSTSAPAGLPLLTAGASSTAVGRWIPGSPGRSGRPVASTTEQLALAAALQTARPDPVTSLTVAGSRGLQARVGSTTFVLGDGSSLPSKVTALVTVAARVDLKGVAVVDLRAPDRPVLTSGRPPASVSTTSTG